MTYPSSNGLDMSAHSPQDSDAEHARGLCFASGRFVSAGEMLAPVMPLGVFLIRAGNNTNTRRALRNFFEWKVVNRLISLSERDESAAIGRTGIDFDVFMLGKRLADAPRQILS